MADSSFGMGPPFLLENFVKNVQIVAWTMLWIPVYVPVGMGANLRFLLALQHEQRIEKHTRVKIYIYLKYWKQNKMYYTSIVSEMIYEH